MKTPDTISIHELAELLQLEEPLLVQLAEDGVLPGKKKGENWNLRRKDVDQWANASIKGHGAGDMNGDDEAMAGRIESFDKDEHAALMGPWDLQLNQLSSGQFQSTIDFVKLPGVMIYEERWLKEATTRGTSPDNLIMLGTNVDWRRSTTEWCGGAIDNQRFACSAPGTEIDFHTLDNCHNVVLLIDPALLATAIGAETAEMLCGKKHIECSAFAGQQLISTIMGFAQKYTEHPRLLDDLCEVGLVRMQLLEDINRCFSRNEMSDQLEPVSSRHAAVRRAIEYLAETSSTVALPELATVSGASQRTLAYGFQEQFGITPGVYLRLNRLNKAHRDLSESDPASTTVTKIALKWGFLHPGRFSLMYHKMFSEKPYETLNKSSTSAISLPLMLPQQN